MTDYDEDEPMRRRPRDVITISDSDDEKAPAPAPKMLPRAPFPSLNLSRPLFSSKAKKPAPAWQPGMKKGLLAGQITADSSDEEDDMAPAPAPSLGSQIADLLRQRSPSPEPEFQSESVLEPPPDPESESESESDVEIQPEPEPEAEDDSDEEMPLAAQPDDDDDRRFLACLNKVAGVAQASEDEKFYGDLFMPNFAMNTEFDANASRLIFIVKRERDQIRAFFTLDKSKNKLVLHNYFDLDTFESDKARILGYLARHDVVPKKIENDFPFQVRNVEANTPLVLAGVEYAMHQGPPGHESFIFTPEPGKWGEYQRRLDVMMADEADEAPEPLFFLDKSTAERLEYLDTIKAHLKDQKSRKVSPVIAGQKPSDLLNTSEWVHDEMIDKFGEILQRNLSEEEKKKIYIGTVAFGLHTADYRGELPRIRPYHVIVPVNVAGRHWICVDVLVSDNNSSCTIYDSLDGVYPGDKTSAVNALLAGLGIRESVPIRAGDTMKQEDSSLCGIVTMLRMQRLALGSGPPEIDRPVNKTAFPDVASKLRKYVVNYLTNDGQVAKVKASDVLRRLLDRPAAKTASLPAKKKTKGGSLEPDDEEDEVDSQRTETDEESAAPAPVVVATQSKKKRSRPARKIQPEAPFTASAVLGEDGEPLRPVTGKPMDREARRTYNMPMGDEMKYLNKKGEATRAFSRLIDTLGREPGKYERKEKNDDDVGFSKMTKLAIQRKKKKQTGKYYPGRFTGDWAPPDIVDSDDEDGGRQLTRDELVGEIETVVAYLIDLYRDDNNMALLKEDEQVTNSQGNVIVKEEHKAEFRAALEHVSKIVHLDNKKKNIEWLLTKIPRSAFYYGSMATDDKGDMIGVHEIYEELQSYPEYAGDKAMDRETFDMLDTDWVKKRGLTPAERKENIARVQRQYDKQLKDYPDAEWTRTLAGVLADLKKTLNDDGTEFVFGDSDDDQVVEEDDVMS